MSELAARIENDLKTAMKAKDKARTGAIRMIRAALQNRRIEKMSDLTDEDVMGVLVSMIKQRRDSIEQFTAGNRVDLADKEKVELEIISTYLPEQMGEEEVRAEVAAAIAAVDAKGPKEMGKVMGVLMPRVKGRADGKLVNQIVRALLAGE